jgi:hypothetical protein
MADTKTLERASRCARKMYPQADAIVVRAEGAEALVLVRYAGLVKMVRYVNLDRAENFGKIGGKI